MRKQIAEDVIREQCKRRDNLPLTEEDVANILANAGKEKKYLVLKVSDFSFGSPFFAEKKDIERMFVEPNTKVVGWLRYFDLDDQGQEVQAQIESVRLSFVKSE